MATLEYHIGQRGYPGFTVSTALPSGGTARQVVPAFAQVDDTGTIIGTAASPSSTQSAALPAGADRSGTAGTASAQLAAANTARRGLNIQNISANQLGVNEMGGTAAIGTAGTYTVAAGASINIRTNRQVNVIASAAGSAFSATEW